MKFVEHNGEDICVLLAQPNRRVRPRLTASLPFTSVDQAISAREQRKTFGRSSRYTLEYTPWLKNAGIATEFRIGLARLKDEPVAVPLWDDCVKLSAACAGGATTLQKTTLNPVRHGAEWIILTPEPLAWNDWTYEIVTVTNVSSSTVSLAAPGTVYAWPAGTLMYPLLFGRLEERPTLKSRKPGVVEGALKIREDSPFARRINVFAPTISTVGAGIPAYSLMPLLDLEATFRNLLDTTEVDIIYKQFGFLRQEQSYTYLQSNRRGLELEFVCKTRDAIAKLEGLFMNRLGPTLPFFVPTFRQDLVITLDLPRPAPNEKLITIEQSEFSNAARPVHPGDPYIALLGPADGSGFAYVDSRKLTSVLSTTLTCAVDITQTHLARNTRLSHLLLVHFASAQITWEYATPHRATARVKFVEVPDEYVTPATTVTEVAYLYKFTKVMPELQVQYFTSYEDAITWDGQVWTPAPFSHGSIKSGMRLEKEEVEITSWDGNFPGNPLIGLFPWTLEGPLHLDIIEVNAANPSDAYARVLFAGKITKPNKVGKDWTVVARWFGNDFDRNIPRFYFQKTCNVAVYSAKCGVLKENFAVACTFFGAPGLNTVVTLTGGAAEVEDYFAAGFCETGTGANFERRPILHSEVIAGKLTITIDKRFRNAANAQAIVCYPGCNGALETCIGRFDNLQNFRGHPYIPIKDPSTNIGEVANAAGGKKG